MSIKELYEKFESIGCLTFATVDEFGSPVTRIAHLRAYDDKGLYFMTMLTKDFYKHLKSNNKISICGLKANSKIKYTKEGSPIFDRGYSIRLNGEVKEVSISDIKNKNNPDFDFCIKDQERYKAMVVFCITKGSGEIFDYDFAKKKRDNKLERIYFSLNGGTINYKGLHINQEKCIRCGLCERNCTFKAISKQSKDYKINTNRCDECGDCFINCPVKAISID